ncbi:Hypothetical predicted protein [Octopus vulgaris]|uniref:Uncharacterized protein n=1 Tax=Octopus vulgaris TaxID=6645 RepID=A0AA36BAL9_OCTVU|nr:Hypothetical predicted protein [Octopus vulgaris]
MQQMELLFFLGGSISIGSYKVGLESKEPRELAISIHRPFETADIKHRKLNSCNSTADDEENGRRGIPEDQTDY